MRTASRPPFRAPSRMPSRSHSRTARWAVAATALAVGAAGLVVTASSERRPVDELDYVIAEPGDDWASIVVGADLSCDAEALRAANGGVPLEAGRIVLIPPTCHTDAPAASAPADTESAQPGAGHDAGHRDGEKDGDTTARPDKRPPAGPPANPPAGPPANPPADPPANPPAGPAPRPSEPFDPAAFLQGGQPIPPVRSDGEFSEGAMRMVCRGGHLSYDDPIVAPGRPNATHLHQFFGNLAIDAFTTAENIRDSGDTTCQGGPLNRSGYWVPALIDHGTDRVIPIQEVVVYYKGEPDHEAGPVQPLPAGLRMISDETSWSCGGDVIGDDCSSLTGKVVFKWCWNGELDSADHRSHLADASYVDGVHTCPASHPTVIPRITYNITYDVAGMSDSSNWRLSSDDDPMMVHMLGTGDRARNGETFHGDWFNGWNVIDATTGETADEVWYRECLSATRNCDFGSIGDGRKMIFPPQAVDQPAVAAPPALPAD